MRSGCNDVVIVSRCHRGCGGGVTNNNLSLVLGASTAAMTTAHTSHTFIHACIPLQASKAAMVSEAQATADRAEALQIEVREWQVSGDATFGDATFLNIFSIACLLFALAINSCFLYKPLRSAVLNWGLS